MKPGSPFSPSAYRKIALFRSFFSGLPHAYGFRDPKSERQFQVKRPVTDQVLFDHLKGKHHYGVYLLSGGRTRAVAADFDDPDPSPVVKFFDAARHYGLAACIEKSKSKGFHAWIFFETAAVAAHKARLVAKHILAEIENPDVEIFPKQDYLDGNITSGNYILAPLFGELVSEGKTVFVDPATLAPYPDQWEFLSQIKRVPESGLDDIIEINELATPSPTASSDQTNFIPISNLFGLPPCALKMLREGVDRYQRVSCFRLAVHLKRIGLTRDMSVDVLKRWADQNRPQNNKRRITEKEIEDQTQYAYNKPYRSYGCQSEAVRPFCRSDCRLMKDS